MRIALVNTSRGWGGAEEQMLAMAGELARRGHGIAVVARRGSPVHERFVRDGHAVLPVVRKSLAACVSPIRLFLKFRKEHVDIVHSHRDHDIPLCKLLSLASRAPLLLTQHCLPARPNSISYSLADRVVTVSEYIASGLRAKNAAVVEKLGIIPNGIDYDQFANPEQEFWRSHPQVGDHGPLLGVVGAFYKRQEELIALMPRLREVFPRLALILIGEDEGRKPALAALANRLEVADAVIFAGRIPRDRMKDALAGLDLNVSTFRNEGFGLSVIEGLAVGTPFVGYRAGGYPEIISRCGGGCLVETVEELAAAIQNLLGDRETRNRLGSGSMQSVRSNFSLGAMINRYETLYAELTGKGRA
jgi:glycosyltransferase involved in cell wall biosynthesis